MQDLPFWKAVLITLGVLVAAGSYFFVTSLFGLKNPWIAFVAVTVWSATGMKLDQAPGIFVGGAVGLLISWSIAEFPALFGDIAVIVPLTAIILAIACKIKDMLPLVCNFGLFAFLTIGTAPVLLEQDMHLIYLRDLAFGAVCFWLLPWLVVRLRPDPAGPER
ncbi:hypothetical protein [Ruegeria arenilitoris]|uniref:hypothetical protein n=1 Tax=Ruegeria arenilitoris TaxID=1173585 RepID=UPI001480FED8|nr:hypothetical protein [Ruegeria arenilitoris]